MMRKHWLKFSRLKYNPHPTNTSGFYLQDERPIRSKGKIAADDRVSFETKNRWLSYLRIVILTDHNRKGAKL
jgi:hypothetical protein